MALPLPELLQVSTKKAEPLNADTKESSSDEQVKQPAFITTASLATFSGASIAVTIFWKVADAAFGWEGRWVPAVAAAVIGIYLLLKALEPKDMTSADKFGAGIVAVIIPRSCGRRPLASMSASTRPTSLIVRWSRDC